MLVRSLALALVIAAGSAAPSLAQTPPASPDASGQPAGPSPAAREAVRKACAADIKTYCGDLQPGQAMRQCMRDNFAKLSPDCQTALKSMRRPRDSQN